jgi:membrane-associated phospholipid phosphatase
VARTRRGSDVLTAVAAASGTALCAWAVAPGIVGTLERAVFRSVNGWPDFLQWPLWSFQTLGVLGMPLVVAGGALLCRRWRLAAGLVLLVPAKLFIEHQVLKELVHRERPGTTIPDAVLRDVPSAGPSFPSGHAVITFAIVVLLWPYLRGRWRVVALALAVLNSVARIYLGAHAPLDVVGGALAGVAVAALLNLLVGVSPGPAVPATPRAPAAPRGGRARRAVLRRRR